MFMNTINHTKMYIIQLCNEHDGSCLAMFYGGFENHVVTWKSDKKDAIQFPYKYLAESYADLIIPHKDWKVVEF